MNVSVNKPRLTDNPPDLPAAVDRFREFLAEQGMRLTVQRRLILQEAFRQLGHFDAEQLYGVLRAAGRMVSRATVYRTLGHLRECGLIREMPQPRGAAKYEQLHAGKHHGHMVCIECGKVIEFYDEKLEAVQERICRRHDFKGMEHRMSIRGLCKECRRSARKGGCGC